MPPEYWGYLVKADKNPSLVFEQLLVSIANYIVRLPPNSYAPRAGTDLDYRTDR